MADRIWEKKPGGWWQHRHYPLYIEALPNGNYIVKYREADGRLVQAITDIGHREFKYTVALRLARQVRRVVFEGQEE